MVLLLFAEIKYQMHLSDSDSISPLSSTHYQLLQYFYGHKDRFHSEASIHKFNILWLHHELSSRTVPSNVIHFRWKDETRLAKQKKKKNFPQDVNYFLLLVNVTRFHFTTLLCIFLREFILNFFLWLWGKQNILLVSISKTFYIFYVIFWLEKLHERFLKLSL